MPRTAAAAATSLVAFALLSAAPTERLAAQATTVVLQPSKDNTLYEDPSGGTSNGAGQYVFIGQQNTGLRRRGLFAFDVAAAVPPGSRIVDVQLVFQSSRTNDTQPVEVTLHRVLADWGEGASIGGMGEGGGGPALANDATWVHRFFPSTNWAALGGDFDARPSASATAPTIGPVTFAATQRLIADVQGFADGAPNAGWLVKTAENRNGTSRRLDSGDNTTGGIRPALTVTFVPPGNVHPVGQGCIGSNGLPFALAVTGSANQGASLQVAMHSGLPFEAAATMLAFSSTVEPWEIDRGCAVYLEPIAFPTLGIRILDARGSSIDSYAIPRNPAIRGFSFAMQSVALDPVVARGFVLSNAFVLVFG